MAKQQTDFSKSTAPKASLFSGTAPSHVQSSACHLGDFQLDELVVQANILLLNEEPCARGNN